MSQKTPPTYTPPAPVLAMSGQAGTQQGYDLASQLYGPQIGAQAQGISDINQGQNYYNNFGPSTLSQAVGNSYMSNIWPQQQAMIQNQFANSGMQNSPALANTEANAYGNMATNVGQYEQGISNQNATNNLSGLLSINPMSYSQPITNDILNQSNTNTNMTNQYNQALAQQQYQQQYNKYAQNNMFAQTMGQVGGAVGGAAGMYFGGPMGASIGSAAGAGLTSAAFGGSGTGGSAFAGGASSFGQASQLAMMYGGGMPNMYGSMAGGMPQSGGSNVGQEGYDQAMSGNTSSGTNLAQSGNSVTPMFGALQM